MEYFQEFSLAQIFMMLFGGAGMFEEIVFRLFVVSGLWYLFKRPSWAIIISALIFGLYHLAPLRLLYQTCWQYPVYQVITTFLHPANPF